VRTRRGIGIPPAALTWRFSRSSAPGGQHVNTSSTKVDLRCDIAMVDAPEDVRQLLHSRLGPVVRVSSSQERSQRRNRDRALDRLCAILDAATEVDPPRHATRPTRASVERRLEDTRRRGARKNDRRWTTD
jgi:ribosome-associated protein